MGTVPMGMGNTAMVGTGTVLPKTGVALVEQEQARHWWNRSGHGTGGRGAGMALVEQEQTQTLLEREREQTPLEQEWARLRWNGNGQGAAESEWAQLRWNGNRHGNSAVGNGYDGAVGTEYWHGRSSNTLLVHIQGPGKLFLIFYHTQT